MQNILYLIDDFLKLIKSSRPQKIFLIYRPSFNKLDFKDELLSLPVEFVHFTSFTPNPKIEEIKEALTVFREKSCDFILAVGGGSSIDVAKAVKYFYNTPEGCKLNSDCEYVENNIPFFAVPTTAGSGSESTPFSVYYENGIKTSLSHIKIIPDTVLLLPSPLLTLPDYVKKTSFMDALSQAIESYWSPISTDESKTYARLAIEGLVSSMEEYLFSHPSLECASEIMTASNFAGRAIAITRTSAPHAMSYKLTTTFGIAHGHSVALSLIEVWKYMNEHINDTVDARGIEYFKNTLDEISGFMNCQSLYEGVQFYENLVNRLELSKPQATEKTVEEFALSVDPSRLKNNPVPLSYETLYKLYSNILN